MRGTPKKRRPVLLTRWTHSKQLAEGSERPREGRNAYGGILSFLNLNQGKKVLPRQKQREALRSIYAGCIGARFAHPCRGGGRSDGRWVFSFPPGSKPGTLPLPLAACRLPHQAASPQSSGRRRFPGQGPQGLKGTRSCFSALPPPLPIWC